jgi:basic membrane lipoprotein Med (substrate-binding protein (PBP1-ABC) superfamily)
VSKVSDITEAKVHQVELEVARLKHYESVMADYYRTLARIRKSAYDAHVEAGFSQKEALQLVSSIQD